MMERRNAVKTSRVCCVLLCVGLLGVAQGADDPTIKGRKLSRWVSQLRSRNIGLQMRASRALRRAPEELRPRIIPKLLPILKSDRENDRYAAAQVLGDYGPAAKAAVPSLLLMLEGTQFERNRAAAAKALGQMLKDAKPSEEIERVTKKLMSVFRDRFHDVQREAVKACGMIGPAAKACIPALKDPLVVTIGRVARDEPNRKTRRAACWTLGRMGPLAKDYIDRLISKMHEEGKEVPEAAEAIGCIGAIHENVVPNMVDFLEKMGRDWRHSPASKMNGWVALRKFGAKSEPAVPLIARYLREGVGTEEPPDVFIEWFRILRAVGPKAKEALPGARKWADAKRAPGGWTKEKLAEVRKEAAAAVDAMK